MAMRFVWTIGRLRVLDLVFFDIDVDAEEERDDVRLGSTHETAPPILEYEYEEDRAFGFGKPNIRAEKP